MKLLFSLSFSILFTTLGFAQQTVYYLKKDGRYVTTVDSADYTRTVSPIDSLSKLYKVKEYYKSGKLKLDAFSLTNTAPVVFEGVYTDYYESGIKRSNSTYRKNIKTGDSYEYYPNGKLYRVINFPPDGDRDSELMDKFLIIANYDSLGTVQVENGNGYYKGYDTDFAYLAEYGKINNNKRDSIWKGEDRKINITFTETYKKGVLVSGSSVKGDKTFSYSASSHKSPEFNGGEQAFGNFLSKNIVYPTYARRNDIHGKVIVTFVIEKNGDLTNIKVLKSVNPVIDDEALRVLKKSPKWLPGLLRGVPVRVQYSIPINFALQN